MLQDNTDERRYISLVNMVLQYGYLSPSRAGDTYSLFGTSYTADLRCGFPVLTTRRMFPQGVWGELAAFVRGAEDLATFKKFGCNYWDENAANWAPNKGKPKEEWQVGHIYGAVWRNFNGVDQLSNVIKSLKEDPYSRRHIVSAWDGQQNGALPPCHIMFQFYVRHGFLHCQVYMRSVDLCVGLPSDVLLYATLLTLVAKDVGLRPATLSFSFGDSHVYTNHIEQWREQAEREPTQAPSLVIKESATTLEFTPSDVALAGYYPAEAIKYAFNA